MKTKANGFTLTELLVTLGVAGTVLALAAPNFREFSRNNRMVAVANDFLGAVQSARTEAIKRQLLTGGVAVCPSASSEEATPTCATADPPNFNGWIVFADTDGNCEFDDGDVLLRTGKRIDRDNTAARYVKSSTDGDCINFAATGFTRDVTGHDRVGYVLFCDERGNDIQAGTQLSAARGIEITETGRARI